MLWTVTSPPSSAVITWDQLKHHVRPAGLIDQDYILNDLLPTAYAYAETMMEAALSTQTITVSYDVQDIGWYAGQVNQLDQLRGRIQLQLPRGPVQTITSVLDVNESPIQYRRHTAGNADYIVPLQPIIWTQTPITVVYQAGYTSIPADILGMMKIHVATMYMLRENVTNLPANVVHRMEEFYKFKGRGTVLA